MRGHYGIGILNYKHNCNIGTLFRSAYCFGADYIFTVGKEYKRDSADTPNAVKHIPYTNYDSIEELLEYMPKGAKLICVENSENAIPIKKFSHPERACYLLGSEVSGLPIELTNRFQTTILPSKVCLNVGITGSILMFDRLNKIGKDS